MRALKSLLCSLAIAIAAFAPALNSAPARACFGDPCDSFCDSIRELNELLPPKLALTDCQLR